MASDTTVIVLSLMEKISTLPAFDEGNSLVYQTKSMDFELTVKASSSYEAALKMGFFLLELKLLPNISHIGTTPTVTVWRASNEERRVYGVFERQGEVMVELDRIVTSNFERQSASSSPAVETNSDTAVNFNSTDALANDNLIDDALRQYFGFTSFRPLQKETIAATLSGTDVLTIVGTGGGKTLMFLLPAVLSSKPTVVVSPIKSLIDDTLMRCSALNIYACKFTGDVPQDLQTEHLQELNKFRVVLVTPEMLDGGPLREKIDSQDLARIVFDEAHTISTWGSTFRPAFKEVCEGLAKAKCPKLLLSATITTKLENNLKEIFGNFKVLRNTIFRDNLYLEVVERSVKHFDELAQYISEREGRDECGIVYCVLPHDVSKLHGELLKRDISTVKYHGQLSEDVKAANYAKWMSGEANVIIANSSFGMGIDKQDVRYVVHAKLPTSVEEYFQQCGRAGRDGLPATCRLYNSSSDKNTLYKLFNGQNKDNLTSQYENLNDLIVMVENPVKCRHKAIMAYFGEARDSFLCMTSCDNCKYRGSFQLTDGTTDALKVVQSVVELTGIDMSCKTLKLFLAGSKQKSVLEMRHCANFGALQKKFESVSLLSKFLNLLIFHEVLAEKVLKKGTSGSITIDIVLGAKAHNVLENNLTVYRYEKS